MSTTEPAGEQLFTAAGIPADTFPAMSWASILSTGSPATDLRAQYGSHLPWGDTAKHTAHSLRVQEAFHRINQSWLLRPLTVVSDTPPDVHQYTLCTPVEKHRALADGNLGVSGITVLQWVAHTSDGGEAVLSKPVALVLGPTHGHASTGS